MKAVNTITDKTVCVHRQTRPHLHIAPLHVGLHQTGISLHTNTFCAFCDLVHNGQ